MADAPNWIVDDLTSLSDVELNWLIDNASTDELAVLADAFGIDPDAADRDTLRYIDTPVEYVRDVLRETLWSKQRDVLDSLVEHPITAVVACHGPGKALDVDEPVPTPNGWVAHGDLRPGDTVFGDDGKPCTVTAVTAPHDRPCFRVTFNDGTSIVAADRHEWAVHRGRGRHGRRIVETQQMADDIWTSNGNNRLARYRIDVAGPLQTGGSTTTIDPYILGYWLGDGDAARPYITVAHDDLPHLTERLHAARIRWTLPPSRRRDTTVAVSMLDVGPLMAGMLNRKHVPTGLLRSPYPMRRALIAGILDADGWTEDDGRSVCVTQTSRRLADGIAELVRTCGLKPTVAEGRATLDSRDVGPAWTIRWTDVECPFRLPRKADKWKPGKSASVRRRSVVAVEPVGHRTVNCIEVDSPTSLYLAGDGMVSTHNSHLAARAVGWWVDTNPPGTARVVTTAPTFRQVRHILWPHIRKVHAHGDLPGEVLTTMWKVGGDVVAFGFSSRDTDEDAVQGIHEPNILVVVDEAGGISETLGKALQSLMSAGRARMLLIGNPPTDTPDSWFQRMCESPRVNTIRIAAEHTPAWTGEEVPSCSTCPPVVPPHPITDHLINQKWVDDVVDEYGEDSAFVIARVHARFPDVITNRTIPIGWVDDAAVNDDPEQVGWIRLGVDVAADGGDEFVIARADGMRLHVVHASSGSVNANAVDVAGVVLREIRQAEADAKKAGHVRKVRVKVDAIGVGWGVASTLKAWGTEGRHNSEVVAVNVSERANDPDRFHNRRAEMWWNMRDLCRPPSADEPRSTPRVALDLGTRGRAQLSTPTYATTSAGKIKIESKDDMRRRGMRSPDRAEACLLALYEPVEVQPDVAPQGTGGGGGWNF